MSDESFFRRIDDDLIEPTNHAVGPWDPNATHGGPPAALAVHELRRIVPEASWRLSSLDVDLIGPVPIAPLRIERELTRDGRRVRLARMRARVGDRVAFEARGWFFATERGRAPTHVPTPKLPAPEAGHRDPIMDSFPYGAAIDWRFVDGSFAQPGPATVWATPRIHLVAGEPMTPLEAAALIADVANGISTHLAFDEWLFIPPSLHIDFVREPATTRVAVSARSFIDADGVGLTRATLLDDDGVIGAVLQALYVAPRH
ncbi:conserved hypothetical protein [Acidimicrobium ferrooxidans DSM 10331]|uniref:Thioesterase superfamily protein n=1 Tax=Acidimicrobium ferrooxidans (strain DSM 10331 / JCM 15462 / NBRC 103882 / ICP) TaxID=525909 RepID=C7M328_ACIFD|nr:thioesterase family protein [Acidimicrobium ferrooxidans]ACU53422.1 conserved hypothetical protein [Acidimicrobium ferrooxidans DSM 10331]